MSETDTLKVFANHLASKLENDELNDVTFVFVNAKHENEETIKANLGLLSILISVFKLQYYIRSNTNNMVCKKFWLCAVNWKLGR